MDEGYWTEEMMQNIMDIEGNQRSTSEERFGNIQTAPG